MKLPDELIKIKDEKIIELHDYGYIVDYISGYDRAWFDCALAFRDSEMMREILMALLQATKELSSHGIHRGDSTIDFCFICDKVKYGNEALDKYRKWLGE